MSRFIEPIVLTGKHVALEPLSLEHENALRAAVADGELSRLWFTSVPAPENTRAYIETALEMRDKQHAMPFVVRYKASGKIVGATRYFNVAPEHRRVEIGYTFYSQSVQRTAVNTECKFLLLQHAFETLRCIVVEFRTNFFNFRSREAIARLGAKQDGILRNHQLLPDGTVRDTVVFSIIESEWPAVKRNLLYLLEAKY